MMAGDEIRTNRLAKLLREGPLDQAKSFAQGMSNAAASNVSGPVDALAWLLRKTGLPIPQNPMGGSEWMAEKGLTAAPNNRLAGLLGEGAGLSAPIAAFAKAPQIAGGLLALDDHAMEMGRRGVEGYMDASGMRPNIIDKQALQERFPGVDFTLSQRGDKATLSKVVVPKDQRGQGVGTDFMSALTQAADADGAQLGLTPSNHFGGSKGRLVDFYRRFGFVPNKGRKADYTVSEAMYRDAKP
jgi:GNAT superfamily N-acetyltransferase